jgi:hypothetical protein
LGFFSFLECFMLKLKAFSVATTSRWLVCFSSTSELLLAIEPIGISVANPVE